MGAAFSKYVSHLTKACEILDLDTAWRNTGVEADIKGSERAEDADNNKSGDSITRGISVSLIRNEGRDKPFAQMRYVAFPPS